jgi:hypothetical protein
MFREMGNFASGGEGQQERFADQRHQAPDAGAEDEEAGQHQHQPQADQAEVKLAHELGVVQQDAQPVGGDRGCHGAEHRQRCQLHDVAGDAQDDVGQALDGFENQPRAFPHRGAGDAEEDGEHHDLQDFVVHHRANGGVGEHVLDEPVQGHGVRVDA